VGVNGRDPRLQVLRRSYAGPDEEAAVARPGLIPHPRVEMPHILLRNPVGGAGRPERVFAVDSLFPRRLTGRVDTASIDEGSADLLYGLVRGLQPRVVLETGTHKGRSTRALVTALWANARQPIAPLSFTWHGPLGHVYTVDAEDYGILTSGAIAPEMAEVVTPIIGFTPDVFTRPPLDTLTGIDFAFLDGDHSADGLDQDLHYLEAHRAPECWVAIDNSRDGGWPGVRQTLDAWRKYPQLSLSTCSGLDLLHLTDAVARSPRAETTAVDARAEG